MFPMTVINKSHIKIVLVFQIFLHNIMLLTYCHHRYPYINYPFYIDLNEYEFPKTVIRLFYIVYISHNALTIFLV